MTLTKLSQGVAAMGSQIRSSMISKKLITTVLLMFLTLLAVYLRMYKLEASQFWYDEAFTGLQVTMPWNELWSSIKGDVHPPVYFIFLKAYLTVVGFSDFNIRIFSVLIGSVLVPISYITFRKLFDKLSNWYALLFALIIAINPFYIEYSREARPYALAVLIFCLAILSYLKASAKSTYKLNVWWFLLGILLTLSFLTHYITLLGVIGLVAYDVFLLPRLNLKLIFKKILIYATIAIFPLAFATYYVPNILLPQYMHSPLQLWIPIVNLSKISDIFYAFLFGVNSKSLGVPQYLDNILKMESASLGFVLLCVSLVTFTFYYTASTQNVRRSLEFVLAIGFVPVVISLLAQKLEFRLIVERYLIQFSFGVVTIISYLLFRTKKFIIALSLILYLLNTYSYISQVDNVGENFTKNLLNDYVSGSLQRPIVIFDDPMDFVVAKYYFEGKGYKGLAKLDNFGKSGNQYTGWAMIENDDLISSYADLNGSQRIFVYKNEDNARDVWYREKFTMSDRLVLSTLRYQWFAKNPIIL